MRIKATTQKLRARVTTGAYSLATRATTFALDAQAHAYKLKIAVGKFLSLLFFEDTISIQSLTSLFFTKAGITDSVTAEDTTVVVPTKNITDTGTFSDVYQQVQSKGFIDRFSIEDGGLYFLQDYTSEDYTVPLQPVFTFGKNVTETANFTDVLGVFTVGKGLTEAPALTDTFTYVKGKAFVDTYTAADVYTSEVGKPVADGITVAESFISSYSKVVADSASWTDLSSMVISPAVQDALGLSDAGSLRSQGYCNFDYFAADYVGISRTF